MNRTFKLKPPQVAMEVKTFQGKDNPMVTYLVMKTGREYHVFTEVEAKQAAEDCGAPKTGKTNWQWEQVWGRL